MKQQTYPCPACGVERAFLKKHVAGTKACMEMIRAGQLPFFEPLPKVLDLLAHYGVSVPTGDGQVELVSVSAVDEVPASRGGGKQMADVQRTEHFARYRLAEGGQIEATLVKRVVRESVGDFTPVEVEGFIGSAIVDALVEADDGEIDLPIGG